MPSAFLFIFALFWSALVLVFDSVIGHQLFHQYLSRNYPMTTGTITYSEVTQHRGSKGGMTYGVDIRYHFKVNGQSFDGDHFRYNEGSSSDSQWAERAVAAHPVGSQTQVFYNPKDPSDAVLSPGIDGSDIMMVLFLTPFNMVGVGLWTSLAGWLRERLFKPVAGGVKIISDGMQTRVRIPEYAAVFWGMAGVGGVSFVSIFILGFSSGFHPSIESATLFLFVSVGAGIFAYAWQWRKIHSGDDDLIINNASGSIELPETYGRKERITVNTSDIESLIVEAIEHRGSKGGTSYTYAPTLYLRNSQSQKLVDWQDKMKAEAFSNWLTKQLHIGQGDRPSALRVKGI